MRLGVEGGVFWLRSPSQGWKADSMALVGLSSLALAPDWNLYVNLVTTRQIDSGRQANGMRLALAWQPDERLLCFVEGLRASDWPSCATPACGCGPSPACSGWMW